MNRNELFDEIISMLPVKQVDKEFRTDISLCLKKYISLLEGLDITVKQSITDWNLKYDRIKKITEAIKYIIKLQYQGLHSSAFTTLQNQMLGTGGIKGGGILDKISHYSLIQGALLYRMRTFEDKKDKTYKDMFHIPLNMRGIVKTQRYSMPGYPCLYLGKTIYACWEELQRPPIDSCMVSCIKVDSDMELLDLRFPSPINWISSFENYLFLLPLIFVCSIVTKNPNDTFKPEYIIPQLLIEFIINQNKKCPHNKLQGIIYTSTLKNNDFGFWYDVFENVAIPVIEVLSNQKYCPQLANSFKITNPTCDEYEQIRCPYGFDGGTYDSKTEEEEAKERYSLSLMGKIEKRLKEKVDNEFYRID